MKKLINTLIFLMLISISSSSMAWYDTNWSYRVPINIPSTAAVNSTIKLDVDFSALQAQLGVNGTFDINSPRVVRPNETLVNSQEFTDRIYNGVIDATSNSRGEIKFILQDAGSTTYYLYFDTVENGSKSSNPQPTINGNFEHSSGTTPTNWTISSQNANGAQNNEVYDTGFGNTYSGTVKCSDLAISNADTSPNNIGNASNTTGRKWHLLGYRNKCEDGSGKSEKIIITKTISVPASNPGNLDFYFQLQAYDSFDGNTNYDFFQLVVNNTPVNHSQLGIANGNGQLRISSAGIGRRNQYSSSLVDAGWQRARLNLSSYANQTVTISFRTNFFSGDNSYRSWIKLDDVVWSIVTASLGSAEQQPPIISMKKTSVVINDFINSSNPKRIPGAIIEYIIEATSMGRGAADSNSIKINDVIPADTEFVSNSMQFITGTSGLTAGTPQFSYSTDGVNYNSSQSVATKYVRIEPLGVFLGANGASQPSFKVKFQVRVK